MAKPFFDFKIEGNKELEKILKELPKAAATSVLKRGLQISAKPLVTAARANAPKGTGTMARSVRAFIMTRTRVQAAVAIGPAEEHFYGVFLEFGTSSIPTQPWLRPAWDTNKRTITNTLRKNLFSALDSFAKRITKQVYAGKLSKAGRKALKL